ncbi:MAG: hypothetical protein O7I42_07490 [Alphaproteobacteria bacterium]|nr:hypothetical protein [Alphaproteobacteria bacterium]
MELLYVSPMAINGNLSRSPATRNGPFNRCERETTTANSQPLAITEQTTTTWLILHHPAARQSCFSSYDHTKIIAVNKIDSLQLKLYVNVNVKLQLQAPSDQASCLLLDGG